MHKARLTKFANWIGKLDSKRFDMDSFYSHPNKPYQDDDEFYISLSDGINLLNSNCQSTACIAGWAPVWAIEEGIKIKLDKKGFDYESFFKELFDIKNCGPLVYYYPGTKKITPAEAKKAIIKFRDGSSYPWNFLIPQDPPE